MFFRANLNEYFMQMFQLKQVVHNVFRYDPRGRPVKHNVAEDDEIEEEDDVEEQGVHAVLDEDVEEVKGIYVNRDNVNLDELDDIDVVLDEELE